MFDQDSNNSILVFLVQNIYKIFRQILTTAFGKKRKFMTKIRTEVFIETSEILIIKRNRNFLRKWCVDCEREVTMLPLTEAALLTGHDVRAIRSMMENQHIHFCYQKSENPRVCLRSLCLF
jgi:hypothetical protein